ncbi:hypothetical protein GCM10022290_10550 [Sagittula marina]
MNAAVQRALIGVYHRLGRKPLQQYLGEIIWRWNHRVPEAKVRERMSASGLPPTETTIDWNPTPVADQMRGGALCAAPLLGGLYWPREKGSMPPRPLAVARAAC